MISKNLILIPIHSQIDKFNVKCNDAGCSFGQVGVMVANCDRLFFENADGFVVVTDYISAVITSKIYTI